LSASIDSSRCPSMPGNSPSGASLRASANLPTPGTGESDVRPHLAHGRRGAAANSGSNIGRRCSGSRARPASRVCRAIIKSQCARGREGIVVAIELQSALPLQTSPAFSHSPCRRGSAACRTSAVMVKFRGKLILFASCYLSSVSHFAGKPPVQCKSDAAARCAS
jgi:hypothetical protein